MLPCQRTINFQQFGTNGDDTINRTFKHVDVATAKRLNDLKISMVSKEGSYQLGGAYFCHQSDCL